MKSVFKILTVVGTGIAIGTVANKLLKSENLRLSGLSRIKLKFTPEQEQNINKLLTPNKEELENCFI